MTRCLRTKVKSVLPALVAGLVAGLAAVSAFAQSGFSVPMPGGGERPFAEPLFWLNATPNDRLPIRERPLIAQIGLTGLAPPAPRRSGLTPWIGMASELNDNGGSGDVVMTLTPGFSYRYETRRLRFDAAYAAEAGLHLQRTDLSRAIQAHGGFASLDYAIDRRSRLSFTNVVSDTRDLRSAPVQGQLAAGTRLISNTAIAGYSFAPSRRSQFDIGLANKQSWVVAPGGVDIVENAVSASYRFALSSTSGLAANSSIGWIDFETSAGASRVSADLTYTRDLGPRLAFSTTLGVLHTSENGGQTIPQLGGTLTHTSRFAQYRLSASRDIIAVPGLTDLARIDTVEGGALVRLDRGLVLDLAFGLQELDIYDAAGTETSSATASGKLSYALRDNVWLWAQLEYLVESTGGVSQTDKRLKIGITRGF